METVQKQRQQKIDRVLVRGFAWARGYAVLVRGFSGAN